MALLKLRLAAIRLIGRFPKTEEIEKKDAALRKEYSNFKSFSHSPEYIRYTELKQFIASGEPEKVKRELNQLTYQASPEYKTEQEFKKLLGDKAIKNFLRIENSETLSFLSNVELSGKPVRFNDLKQAVESNEYQSKRKEHKKQQTDDYQREVEYNTLRKSSELKRYFKLKNSSPVKDYFAVKNSDLLNKYYALKEHVESSELIERKKYLLSKNKFETSDTFQKVQEFKALEKSEKIVWFNKVNGTDRFKEIERWELTFSDEFEAKEIDKSKWLTRYFWGDALMGKNYSLAADLHWYADTKNIEQKNSVLSIITKKENSDGLAWNLNFGLTPKTFQYTSGIVNTGQTFRQKFGKFEAKVRFTAVQGVYHAFWLVGEKMLPEIDIFRKKGKDNKSVQGAYFWANGDIAKSKNTKTAIGGFDFSQEFFILSIEWDAEAITWKINGEPYKKEANNLPDCPVYVVLSSGVTEQANDQLLPAKMEVDWVRCWKEVAKS
jgi:beta-glucanase (GH16 family)